MEIKKVVRKGVAHILRILGIRKYLNVPVKQMLTDDYLSHRFTTYSPQKLIIYPAEFLKESLPLNQIGKLNWKFTQLSGRLIPEASVTRFKNARIYGSSAAIITEEDILLADLSREFGNRGRHSLMDRISISPPRILHQNIAVIATAGSDTYYHWMFDILPRIHLIQQSDLFSKIDLFALPQIKHKFQTETLAYSGIEREHILELKYNSHYTGKNIFVPSLPSLLGTVNKWTVQYIRKLVPEVKSPVSAAKIYISRRGADVRGFINEDQIIACLKNRGYEEVDASKYTVAQQAAIFRNAKSVIAAHGSGLVNTAFCEPGTTVVDLFSDDFVVPCFWTLANINKLRYYYVTGGGDLNREFDPYWESKGSITEFNIESLESVLNQIEA